MGGGEGQLPSEYCNELARGPLCSQLCLTLNWYRLAVSLAHRVGKVLSFFSNSPNPSPAGQYPPPPTLGRDTLAGERGVGRIPVPMRGHTLWYSLYIRTLSRLSLVGKEGGNLLFQMISTCRPTKWCGSGSVWNKRVRWERFPCSDEKWIQCKLS